MDRRKVMLLLSIFLEGYTGDRKKAQVTASGQLCLSLFSGSLAMSAWVPLPAPVAFSIIFLWSKHDDSEDRIGSEGHKWGKCYVHLLVNRSTENILCALQVSSLAPWTKVPYFVSALGTLFTTHPPTPTPSKLRMSLDGLNLSLFFQDIRDSSVR